MVHIGLIGRSFTRQCKEEGMLRDVQLVPASVASLLVGMLQTGPAG